MPVLAIFILTHSTHSVVLMLIQFELICVFKADDGLVFVMESTKLWCLWIYFTSIISCYLYNWPKLIISTINHFSCIVLNLTRHLYKDLEFVHKISGIATPNIYPSVAFITTPMSNLYVIPYSSAVKTLHVTRLYLIED